MLPSGARAAWGKSLPWKSLVRWRHAIVHAASPSSIYSSPYTVDIPEDQSISTFVCEVRYPGEMLNNEVVDGVLLNDLVVLTVGKKVR